MTATQVFNGLIPTKSKHCVKSVKIRSFFRSIFGHFSRSENNVEDFSLVLTSFIIGTHLDKLFNFAMKN